MFGVALQMTLTALYLETGLWWIFKKFFVWCHLRHLLVWLGDLIGNSWQSIGSSQWLAAILLHSGGPLLLSRAWLGWICIDYDPRRLLVDVSGRATRSNLFVSLFSLEQSDLTQVLLIFFESLLRVINFWFELMIPGLDLRFAGMGVVVMRINLRVLIEMAGLRVVA